MSFSNTAMHRVARMAPDLRIVQLVDKAHHWPMVRRMVPQDWIIGPDVHEMRDHPGLARRLREDGREVHCWVVNTEEDVAVCERWGVSALISDRPREVRKILERDLGLGGAAGGGGPGQ